MSSRMRGGPPSRSNQTFESDKIEPMFGKFDPQIKRLTWWDGLIFRERNVKI